jgi:DNA-binding response OmpR family regulator
MEVKPMAKDKPSILIFEDDASIHETLNTILQKKGYNTDTAKNGKEATKIKSQILQPSAA